MSNYNGADAASKGSPNLEYLQYLQDKLGVSGIDNVIKVNKTSITASGSSGVDVAGIPVGAEIVDIVVHSKATSGSGTVQLSVGGGGAAISDAITMATLDAVTRLGTLDTTYKFVSADGLTLTTNADADLGDVFIYYRG